MLLRTSIVSLLSFLAGVLLTSGFYHVFGGTVFASPAGSTQAYGIKLFQNGDPVDIVPALEDGLEYSTKAWLRAGRFDILVPKVLCEGQFDTRANGINIVTARGESADQLRDQLKAPGRTAKDSIYREGGSFAVGPFAAHLLTINATRSPSGPSDYNTYINDRFSGEADDYLMATIRDIDTDTGEAGLIMPGASVTLFFQPSGECPRFVAVDVLELTFY